MECKPRHRPRGYAGNQEKKRKDKIRTGVANRRVRGNISFVMVKGFYLTILKFPAEIAGTETRKSN